MPELVLCVDVGSTFTKAVLVDADVGRVLGTAQHPTTLPDVMVGIAAVREALAASVGKDAAGGVGVDEGREGQGRGDAREGRGQEGVRHGAGQKGLREDAGQEGFREAKGQESVQEAEGQGQGGVWEGDEREGWGQEDVLEGNGQEGVWEVGSGPVAPGAKEVLAAEILACSSAGGGLRLAVVGHERLVTAEAGQRVALSAGGRVVHLSSGPLTPEGVKALKESRPDLIVLTGGTDGGNSDVVLHNARRIGIARLAAPVVLACNRDAADAAAAELRSRGRLVTVTDNVLPSIGVLNPGPAREAIRAAFLQHVIGGKGLSRNKSRINGKSLKQLVLAPTPDAVLTGVEALADGRGLLLVDVGGATTDVYSVLPRLQKDEKPEDGRGQGAAGDWLLARTVEGDLGVRSGVLGVVEAALAEGLVGDEEARKLTLYGQEQMVAAGLPGDGGERSGQESDDRPQGARGSGGHEEFQAGLNNTKSGQGIGQALEGNGQAGQGNGLAGPIKVQAGQESGQAGQKNAQGRQQADRAGLGNGEARQQADRAGLGNGEARQQADRAGLGNGEARQQVDRAGRGNGEADQRDGQASQENDQRLAHLAVLIALRRHGRPLHEGAPPRPLREAELVVGSGGVLRHATQPQRAGVLNSALTDHAGGWAVPERAALAVDARYTVFAAGLLSGRAKPEAVRRLAATGLEWLSGVQR